jgi:predicted metalloendopeptidase
MIRRAFILAASIAIAACGAKPDGTATASADAAKAAAVAPAKAAIGDYGLDRTTAKPEVRPGEDFFAHANGKWYDTFEIPADRVAYGVAQKLDELSEQQVRAIIEEAAAAKAVPGTPQQRIGDYYAAYMDEAAVEAKGLEPLKADLERIAAAGSKRDIATLFGLPGFKSTFDVEMFADAKDPNRYALYLGHSGLGLPDRDYYLRDDPKLAEARKNYQAYVEKMLALGGIEQAPKKARDIMAFETAVARVHWPLEKRRDVDATFNPRTKAELVAYAPGFDWQAFFDAAEIGSREQLVLLELSAIRDLAKLLDRTDLATLKAYLTFHYLSDHAQFLPKRFDDARFELYGKQLRGQPQQRERWKRAVDLIDGALGEQVGQLYVARHFPPESKAKMEELVANLREALRQRIEQLEWMTPETRKRALEKLGTFVTKIGYPDKWKDYSSLEVRRDDLVGNVHRAALWAWRYDINRLDQPVDRTEWGMSPQTVNAYYNPLANEIVFPAAILQPPFFDPHADPAINYGAIGAVIGHEIGHGFDDQGRKFAADGSLKDWWTQKDTLAFTARAAKLIKQYSQFQAIPGLNVNGALTIGENIGDLGGLNMAYHAYKIALKGEEPPVIDGLTGDQRFFLAYAQGWRTKYREGLLREIVLSDVHSPAYFRVNGVVRNMSEWYAAFDVKPEDALYLPPEERVQIW